MLGMFSGDWFVLQKLVVFCEFYKTIFFEGMLLTGAACTSELQMWHKPPKLGDEEQSGRTVNELFVGPESSKVEPSQESTKFAVDASLNFGLHTSFNKVRRCNLIGLYHDHNYCSPGFKEYVDSLNCVSIEEIPAIERDTITQSSSEFWFQQSNQG